MSDAVASLEARLQALRAHGEPTRELVDVFHALSYELLSSSTDRILDMNEEALRAADQIGYAAGRYMSLIWIGMCHYWKAQYEMALQMLHRAIAGFEAEGHRAGHACALTCMVFVQQGLGNLAQALASGLEALDMYRTLEGEERWEAWNLLGLGNTYFDLNDYERAIALLRRSLELFDALGFAVGQARALTHIAATYKALEQYENAESYYERSLALFRASRNSLGESRVLDDMGRVQEAQGDYDAAMAFYRQSLRIREALDNWQVECTSLISMGRLYNLKGMPDEALPVLRRALEQAEAIRSKPKRYEAHRELATACEATGNLREALHHIRAFQEIREAVVGEETRARINHLQISFEVAQAEKEAEIERLRNVELKATNERLEQLLAELKATQRQLIQREKMASLGQLTAGIAHEIKNPLNFVNNFAGLNLDLFEELDEWSAASPGLGVGEAAEILEDVRENSRRIRQHGMRADRIVQNMMRHAAGGTGRREPTDVNALVGEYTGLAYHSLGTMHPGFALKIERDLAEGVGEAALVPQEIGQVLLNLLTNAFDAVKGRAEQLDASFAPHIRVATRRLGEAVAIRVEDNGPGIPSDLREKIFEPFFTTKPAGSGTGLGLSLSFDVVTQGHEGTLTVEDAALGGAAFVLTLPG